MKQNTRQIKNTNGGGSRESMVLLASRNHAKRQIKKKQRRFFRDEKGESLLSKLSKSSSLMIQKPRRKKPLRWSENETNTFYKCLEFFGKDFEMITSVFHNKRKRQILRKFHKERKRFPERVAQSLQKHESNQIKKTYKDTTFFDNFFDQTDTSDDEASFLENHNLFARRPPHAETNLKRLKENSIILEGLIEEEQGFERQIDRVNDQKGASGGNCLNDLLFKINTDNGFRGQRSLGELAPFDKSPSEVTEVVQTKEEKGVDFEKEFWVSNRVDEESEQPPPRIREEDSSDLYSFLWTCKNFEQFDYQLKQQSDVEIKPLEYYLNEAQNEGFK